MPRRPSANAATDAGPLGAAASPSVDGAMRRSTRPSSPTASDLASTGPPMPVNSMPRRSPQPTIAATTPATTSATTSTASTSASARTQPGAGAARRRAGRVPSSSRAAASPPRGTSTSRGPAARKSGTSKPPERRASDGMPGLEQQPLEQLGLGLVLRASRRAPARPRRRAGGSCARARAPRRRAATRGRRAPARARTASRSAGRTARSPRRRCRTPGTRAARPRQPSSTSSGASETCPSRDAPGAHVVALGVLDADDQVDARRAGTGSRG